MIAGIAPSHPEHLVRGELHGRLLRTAVRTNIGGFLRAAEMTGWDIADLRRRAAAARTHLDPPLRAELDGIATGAAVDADTHLLYALAGHWLAPDECTVAAAVGGASASGATVLLKNSDKIGADSLVGNGFHGFKEINVVVDLVTDDGIRIVAVAAAGSPSLKMGVNDAGVVAASNIVRTTELRLRRPDLADLRALDRGRLLRDGLGHRDTATATGATVAALLETPMATPGNIEFAEARRMTVIEGSYAHLAVADIEEEVVARSNMFVSLDHLNDPADTSSPVRYQRAISVLERGAGGVTVDDLRALSQDHTNGPGVDSICRHSDDPRDETSLSAMVVAVDPHDPRATSVEIALGKPCWAWLGGGVMAMRMGDPPGAVAERFLSGRAWIENYREDPRT